MSSGKAIVLDVGHGNCTIVHDDRGLVVVDAAPGAMLLEYLREEGQTTIDVLLISHADSDHIAGASRLLIASDITVNRIYVNPDPRQNHAWDAFKIALVEAKRRSGTRTITSLNTDTSADLVRGDVRYEVLSPNVVDAVSGVGAQSPSGVILDPNRMSAVIRVVCEDRGQLFLGADLTAEGLDQLMGSGADASARVVVFPHHGGKPGGADPGKFAAQVCSIAMPEMVVFSIGRGRYSTPIPEIVSAVLEAVPGVRIACTQLSRNCSASVPSPEPVHLTRHPAKGKLSHQCCAGTIELLFSEEDDLPLVDEHQAFITQHVESPMCRA